jgi:hypothetical protein
VQYFSDLEPSTRGESRQNTFWQFKQVSTPLKAAWTNIAVVIFGHHTTGIHSPFRHHIRSFAPFIALEK